MTNEPTSPNDAQQNTNGADDDATVEMSVVSAGDAASAESGWKRVRPANDPGDAAPAETTDKSAETDDDPVSESDPEPTAEVVEEPGVAADPDPTTEVDPEPAAELSHSAAHRRTRTREVRRWSRRRVGIVLGSAVGVVLALYGVAYLAYGDQLAQGATVAGVDVGGLSPQSAQATLERELPAVLDTPMVITVGDDETAYELTPAEAGMSIDIPATIADVPGGSANPASLVEAMLGADDVPPVPVVDDSELTRAIEAIAEESDAEAVNGGVAFDGGAVVTSEPATGRDIDVSGSVDVVTGAFFGRENAAYPYPEVTLPSRLVPPDITEEEVERAVTEFAEPAMSGPVTVRADGESVDLSPDVISQALSMVPENGELQANLDGAKLSEVAHDQLGDIGQEGKDATIVIENNQPVVVAEEHGLGVAPDDLAASVLPALTQSGDERVADVELSEVDPALTADLAEDLGVEEVVSEFTTTFPHAHYRNVNIGLAAQKIDNTLLKPGDTFSLNGLVGERTAANGFAIGGIISGGVVVEDYGGGVSQVATTMYHTAFQAGLEDIEHRPHSIYFSRYPIAAEATVSWGNFDMAFKNDTPHGIVVDTIFTASTSGSQGVLTVKLWSTPHYEVETSVSDRSNFTSPSTVYNSSDNCIANSAGSQGFNITSFRQVWDPDGELVKDESYPWTYRPNPKVICGEKPEEDEEDEGE